MYNLLDKKTTEKGTISSQSQRNSEL